MMRVSLKLLKWSKLTGFGIAVYDEEQVVEIKLTKVG